MFCKFCGKEINENDSFCQSCGKRLDSNDLENTILDSIFASYSFLISAITSPTLLIIRILTLTSQYIPAGVDGSWKGRTVNFVPDNIKPMMWVLLVLSVSYSVYSIINYKNVIMEKKRSTLVALNIINVIAGMIMILAES